MSVIVAYKTDSEIYVGSEYLCSYANSNFIENRRTEKIFKRIVRHKDGTKDEFILGSVGTYRLMQILKHDFNIPYCSKDSNVESYMVTKFVPQLKRCLASHDFKFKKAEIMVIFRGHIFSIQSDWQVNFVSSNYYAIGSGKRISLGSLYALDNVKMSPKIKVETSIQAASKFDSSCGNVCYFEKIKLYE